MVIKAAILNHGAAFIIPRQKGHEGKRPRSATNGVSACFAAAARQRKMASHNPRLRGAARLRAGKREKRVTGTRPDSRDGKVSSTCGCGPSAAAAYYRAHLAIVTAEIPRHRSMSTAIF